MRAVVIREPGGPEVLEVVERADPQVPEGHVRIAVAYAGVNRADLLQRAGGYPAPPGVPADVPGLEYAGRVEALGPNARRFAVGDRVYGLVGGGAYAEKVVLHEREVAPTPAELTDEQAAAVPEAFVTAWDAIVDQGGLAAGDTLLVHAAASGVGTAALQIGRALGCTVIGTSRTPEKLARLPALGLDHALVPAGGRFADGVLAATGGRGADVVLDLVGGPYVPESLACLAPRGRLLLVGLTAGRRAEVDLGLVLRRRATVVGTVLRARPLEEKIAAAQLLERRIGPLLAAGRLSAVIDRVLPLAEAAEAHRHVAANATFGKVILRVAP